MITPPLFPVPMERLCEEDLALARTVSEWADRSVLAPRAAAKHDYEALLGRAWADLQREVGLAGALIPEALGGAGRDRPDAAHALTLAAEEVGRADLGLAFSLASFQAVTATAMLGPRPASHRARLASLLAGGDAAPVLALVMPSLASIEADAAIDGTVSTLSDGRIPQARARKDGDGWILEAREARPLHAGTLAGLFAIVCAVEGAPPRLFLVPAGAPGLRRGAALRQTGLTVGPNASLSLDGVRAGEEQCLCEDEEGLRALQTWLRLLTAAGAVGALTAAYAILGDWGEHRVIKGRGQIFKENPLTASLMGDLAARLCWGRLLVHDLAHFVARPQTYGPAGAEPVHVTGVSVHAAVMASAEEALGHTMELMASAGYAREWFLERYWRDLKTSRGLLGGAMLGRLAVARHAYQCKTL